MAQPGVISTVVGASKLAQLDSNIAASDLPLTDEQRDRLSAASQPAPGFSAGLAAPAVRRMIYGGNGVLGWTH